MPKRHAPRTKVVVVLGCFGTISFEVDDGRTANVENVVCVFRGQEYNVSCNVSVDLDDQEDLLHGATEVVNAAILTAFRRQEVRLEERIKIALSMLQRAPEILVGIARAILGTSIVFDTDIVNRQATLTWAGLSQHLELDFVVDKMTDFLWERPHPTSSFDSIGQYLVLLLDDKEVIAFYLAIFDQEHWNEIGVSPKDFGVSPEDFAKLTTSKHVITRDLISAVATRFNENDDEANSVPAAVL